MKKRLVQALITSIVMSSLVLSPVFATPQDKVDDLEAQKSQVEAEAAGVQSQLASLLLEYEALQQDIANQEVKIEEATQQLAEAEAEEQQQYEDMKLRIQYMYEEGDTSFVETLVTAESFSDLVSKSEYVQKVHDYDREKLQEYIEITEEVEELKTNLEAEQADMQFMAEEMERQQVTMESTLSQMEAQIADFDEQLEVARAEVEAELERARQEAAAAAAAQQQQQQQQTGSNNNANTSTPSTSTGNSSSSGSSSGSSSSNSSTSKPSNASRGQQIADRACQYIGNKYVYGGTSLTNGIDCSGFVQAIHAQFGISTPRTSSAQRSGGRAVSASEMLPGDVVCYSGHVAIYIGNGKIVHASNSAPYPQGGIKISNNYAYRTVLAIRRYW